MRILITGFIILVIWSFFSMWLYVDILKPQTKPVVVVQPAPENQNREADSLARFYASMPKDLKIFFDFDKTKMLAAPGLDSGLVLFKAWMEKYPATIFTVTGHTDFIGTAEYNAKLAAERAEVVRKLLVEKGIPAEKLVIVPPEGDLSPSGQILSSERANNRRTQVTIKK